MHHQDGRAAGGSSAFQGTGGESMTPSNFLAMRTRTADSLARIWAPVSFGPALCGEGAVGYDLADALAGDPVFLGDGLAGDAGLG